MRDKFSKLKTLFFIFFIFVANKSFGQLVFEQGYFVDNSGKKVLCLIKNLDWANNPKEFKFKLLKSNIIQTNRIDEVKEFGINGFSKYIKAKVKIDQSSKNIEFLSENSNPEWKEDVVFLKVLAEGKANLYQFSDKSDYQYYYSLTNQANAITPLVYKKYFNYSKSKQGDNVRAIATNNAFVDQLKTNLSSSCISKDEFSKITYSDKDLIALFNTFNGCKNTPIQHIDAKDNREVFNIKIKARLENTQLHYYSDSDFITDAYGRINKYSADLTFQKNLRINFGIETEFFLNRNKNKYSFIFDPSYSCFISQAPFSGQQNTANMVIFPASVSYKTILLPFGFRYYMYLNNNSKFFVNAVFIPNINLNSDLQVGSDHVEVRTKMNGGLGFGYAYKKVNFEMRMYPTGNIVFYNSYGATTNYKNLSFILGYNFYTKTKK